MHFLTTILFLASSTSAIDIIRHALGGCTGYEVVNRAVGPDQCISETVGSFYSVSWEAIPKEWSITVSTYGNNGCTNRRNQYHSNERTRVCVDSQVDNNWVRYKSAGYSFDPIKRSVEEAEKQDCKKPDLLVLEDGTTYDIAGLDDDVMQTMISRTTASSHAI